MICFLAIKDSNTYNATMQVKCNIGKSVSHNLQIYYEYMCLCSVSTSSSMICLFSKCISKRLALSMIMSDNYKYDIWNGKFLYVSCRAHGFQFLEGIDVLCATDQTNKNTSY